MSFSFSSLVRLIVLMIMGTTMLAVGVSRLEPRKPTFRTRRPASSVNINEYFLEATDRVPRWLKVDTGQVAAVRLENPDVLEVGACSPWVDEKGRCQMVGRWASRTMDGPLSTTSDFGLARYSFPDGRLLDQVSTEIVPVSPPCWFPGTRARILFAAGDGNLYHFAFEPEAWDKEAVGSSPGHDDQPNKLAWRCRKPGVGDIYLSDPSWPEDPRMEGRVVVALRMQVIQPNGRRGFTRNRLWWLKLNHAGTEVVDAGRLITPNPAEVNDDTSDERVPSITTMPDGRTALAYLHQPDRQFGWELRIATVQFDGPSHAPGVSHSKTLVLMEKCQPSPPAFSTDALWINALAGQNPSESRVSRISMVNAFARMARPEAIARRVLKD